MERYQQQEGKLRERGKFPALSMAAKIQRP
jgi:hypothetical protein